MKNAIYNYYNILVDELNKSDNNYFFYFNDELFLFYLVLNDVKLVENIYRYIIENNIESFNILPNKDGNLFSEIDNKKYALLRVNGILKYEFKFDEFKFYPIDEDGIDWGTLWGERLDYYEVQIRELGIKYQTVLNSFGMFSGLAENAILYFNMTLEKFGDLKKEVGIVHNRVKYPCYLIDYYNPLNYVIDYNVRDISEYIKSYVISDDFDVNNVIALISRMNLNDLMFNLLYARLLYPTFYFDVFDKIILEDGKDNDIVFVLNKLNNYLEMLKSVYNGFNSKYDMFRIEWLNKIKM